MIIMGNEVNYIMEIEYTDMSHVRQRFALCINRGYFNDFLTGTSHFP